MKIHEILHEDSWDEEDPSRLFANPLPIIDATYEFDVFDELDSMFINEYKRAHNLSDKVGLSNIGKILIAGRLRWGNIEEIPIEQISAIEPYLYPEHLKSLVAGEDVKVSSKQPLILKYDDRYIAADGNHRIVAAMQRGEKTIQALVLDLNKYESNHKY